MPGAHEFFSDTPPGRIMGFETEQDVAELQRPEGWRSMHDPEAGDDGIVRLILPKALKNAGVEYFPLINARPGQVWLRNGGLLYIDVGRMEYASPEYCGPQQITNGMYSSERQMQPIITQFMEDNEGYELELYRRTGIIDEENLIRTMAFHNNISVPETSGGIRQVLLARLLPLHLSTENWSWAGMVTPDGFSLSQKVHDLAGPSVEFESPYHNRRALRDKPMIAFRGNGSQPDDTYASGFQRIETRCNDYSSSEIANFAHWGSLSLIARLTEHPEFITPLLDDLCDYLPDPTATMHIVAADESLNQPLCRIKRTSYTANSIQSALIDAVTTLTHYVQLPDDELMALEAWRTIVGSMHAAAKKGRVAIHHLVGWSAKLDVLEAKLGRKNIRSENPQAHKLCMYWDRTVPQGFGQRYMRAMAKKEGVSLPTTEEDISYFVNNPPANTRAAHRVAFADRAGKRLWSLGWARGSTAKNMAGSTWPLYAGTVSSILPPK